MNVDHLRVVRARDLVDHRLSEIAGFVQGVSAARGHNARALRMLVRWIESAEELHDIWPVSRWREAARWILDTNDPDPEAVARTWRYIGHGSPKLVERVRRQRLRPIAEYDDPAPPIVFEGRVFVLTGIFESCSRGSPEEPGLAEAATTALGGTVHPRTIQRADYLVVGARANPAWKHSRFGRKIQRVQEWRKRYKTECAIVTEEHWAAALWEVGHRVRRQGA